MCILYLISTLPNRVQRHKLSFSGKSLLLKERAIRSKNKNRNVIVISLGSCNLFGTPYNLSSVYDIITKEEMKRHGIVFKGAADLAILDQCDTSEHTKEDNRQYVLRKGADKHLTTMDLIAIFKRHGINYSNACSFLTENRKSASQHQQEKDVYDNLKYFVKTNNQHDIYIDEFPVLISKTSKLIHIYFPHRSLH